MSRYTIKQAIEDIEYLTNLGEEWNSEDCEKHFDIMYLKVKCPKFNKIKRDFELYFIFKQN